MEESFIVMYSVLKVFYLTLVTAFCCHIGGTQSITSGLDPSWSYIINRLFSDGVLWGKNVIFTYGPFGFLPVNLPIGNNARTALIFWSIISISEAAFFWYVLFSKRMEHINSRKSNVLAACFLFYAGSVFVGEGSFVGGNSISFLIVSLLAYSWCNNSLGMFIGASVLTAANTFMKFDMAAASYIALGLFALSVFFEDRAGRWKYLAVCCLVPVVSCGAFLIYNPSLNELYYYIRGAYEISSGYNSSMSYTFKDLTPFRQIFNYVLMAASVVVLFAVVKILGLSRVKFSFGLGCSFLVFMFFSYKHSAVRSGYTSWSIFVSHLITYSSVYVLFMKQEIHLKESLMRELRIFMYTFFCVTLVLGSLNGDKIIGEYFSDYLADIIYNRSSSKALQPKKGSLSLAELFTGWMGNPVPRLCRRLTKLPDYLAVPPKEYDNRKFKPPENFLPLVRSSSTAVYPVELSQIEDFTETYKTMPVPQAYSAYTTWLDGLNAEFFRDENTAPRYVLFGMDTIDKRFPLLECPATWLELFRNYRIVQSVHMDDSKEEEKRDKFLLERTSPKEFVISGISTEEFSRDDVIPVPEVKQHCLMKLEMPLSLIGKAARFFWKIPPVWMEAEFQNGEKLTKRVLLEPMAHDTMISPLAVDDESFTALMAGNLDINRIKSIRFLGDGLSYYSGKLRVTFSELSY